MFNKKQKLILLALVLTVAAFLFLQNKVSAQWVAPPSSPGQGDINPPLTNPLQVDLNFQDESGTRHNIINAQNGTFSGTLQSNILRGNNVCINGVCKNTWPTGDVTNPLSSDLRGDDKFGIIDLRSCQPKEGQSCSAVEAVAEVNETGDVSIYSAGVKGETISSSGSATSYGLYGISNNTGGIGVFGQGNSGWAGYFYGNFGVTGPAMFYGDLDVLIDPQSGSGGELSVESSLCLSGDCISNWSDISGGGGESLWQQSGSNIYYNLGNVGVNISNPTERLQVAGNVKLDGGAITEGDILSVDEIKGYNDLFLKGNAAENADVHLSGSNLRFWTNSTQRMTILNNGNVGIGTNGPTERLNVVGNILLGGANPSNLSAIANNNLRFNVSGVGDFQWYSGAVSRMSLLDNGTFIVPGAWDDQFVVQQTSGNVGIHKGTPDARLHIETSDLNASGVGFRMGGRGNFYIDSSGVMGGRFAILDGGNVGIGIAAPTQKLEVNGNIKGTQLCIGADCRSAWPAGASLPAGVTGQTLRYDGANWVGNSLLYNNGTNIGIGYSSPDAPLTFAGAVGQKIHLYGSQANGYSIGVQSGELRIASGTGPTDRISFMTQGYNGTERLRLTGDGKLGLGTTAPNEKFEIRDDTAGIARLRITDTAENPELQLQWGGNANDHWSIYNKQEDDSLRIWSGTRGEDVLAINGNGDFFLSPHTKITSSGIYHVENVSSGSTYQNFGYCHCNDGSGDPLGKEDSFLAKVKGFFGLKKAQADECQNWTWGNATSCNVGDTQLNQVNYSCDGNSFVYSRTCQSTTISPVFYSKMSFVGNDAGTTHGIDFGNNWIRATFSSAPICDNNNRGAIYYNTTNANFYGCRSTGWSQLNN